MGRSRKRSKNQFDGVLVLNKPGGPTSAGCLSTIRRALDQGKIGHAGTLDPMATGVLLVLLGQATKLASFLTEGQKTYLGEMRLGISTDTYDIEGTVAEEKPFDHLTCDEVASHILSWTQLSEQEVPPVSAAKHQGKPLYALVREGKEVPVKIKAVTIFHAEVLEMDLPRIRFRITVSAGTYVRSLVHSLGMRLGCGATLTELIREQCHPFGLEQAYSLDDIVNEPERFPERVIPMRDALPHWPRVILTEDQTLSVRNGTWLPVELAPALGADGKPGDRAILAEADGAPVALAEAKLRDGSVQWSILRGLW